MEYDIIVLAMYDDDDCNIELGKISSTQFYECNW